MKVFEKLKKGRLRIFKIFGVTVWSRTVHGARPCVVRGANNRLDGIPKGCAVEIHGSDNQIVFEEPVARVFDGCIYIGAPDCPARGCKVTIGGGCTANGVTIRLMEDGSRCVIGEDCMISADVRLSVSDTHAITDRDGRRLNKGEFIEVGSHVWIGEGATLLKNTVVPQGCVVGTRAVVSGRVRCANENSVIAGNPAKIVKEGIVWHRERPQQM